MGGKEMDRMKGLFWGIVICIIITLLAGCTSMKYVPVYLRNDSVRTVVKTETVYEKDTAYIEIPRQTAERITKDTISSLENDFAVSDAWITSDGTLHHTLATKEQELPFEYDKKIERTDSTSTKQGTTTILKTVEKELSWCQQTQIYGFWALAAIIVVWLLWKSRGTIKTFIRKLI